MHKNIFGHQLEVSANYGMGGGIEEVIAWCHTCDPTGSELIFSQEAYSTQEMMIAVKEAVLTANNHALAINLN